MGGDCKKRRFVCGRHHAKTGTKKQQKNLVCQGLVCVGNQKKLQSYKRLREKH
jgi:hypothetical protein